MSPKEEESTIRNYSHVFVTGKRRGDPHQEARRQYAPVLIKKYLAYQPRDSFEGFPPIEDEACVKWVWKIIRDGDQLGCSCFGRGHCGTRGDFFHRPAAVRNADRGLAAISESRDWHELVRSSIHLAHEMGFKKVWLSVDAANLRARHIYKECGFECLSGDRGDVEMVLDLKGQHKEEQ